MPDHTASYGSNYWWEEMVYQGALGGVYPIVRSEGKLAVEFNQGVTKELSPQLQDMYNQWWYEVFESKFLENQDDE